MALEPSIKTECRRAGAALGALMATSLLASSGNLAAISPAQAQDGLDAAKVVQLTPAQCRGVAGFATDHFKAAGPSSLGMKFFDSVLYFIGPDGETATCNGRPILDHAICRSGPGVASAPVGAERIKAVKAELMNGASYLISPDHKTVVCNPGPEDKTGVPTIIISSVKDLSVWSGMEDSGFRTGANIARAVRLVADPKGDPRIPDLLGKRLKALAARDKITDARPSPR